MFRPSNLSWFLFAAFAACLVPSAEAAYGVRYDPAHPENAVSSYLIPENWLQFKMRQPDGVMRVFQRDLEDPRVLHGESPWAGEIDGSRALVMTDPGSGVDKTGFLFSNGRLRKLLLDGKEYSVRADAGRPEPKREIPSLWPKITAELVEEASRTYSVNWANRFRLWYQNPNHAALLLAQLAIVLGSLLLLRRWLLVPIALVAILACLWGIVASQSRSGMLAVLAGFACLGVFRLRSLLSVRNILLALAMVGLLVGLAWSGGMLERFTGGMVHEGYSDVSRLPIWQSVPRMMAAAPFGWGLGNSGEAYIDWFQPIGRAHVIHALISSHLTWLVEFALPVRFLYVFAWAAIIIVSAVKAFRGGSPLPMAVWFATCIGLMFNTLGSEPTMWVFPLASLALWGFRSPQVRLAMPLVCAAGLSLAVVGSLEAAGRIQRDALAVHGGRGRVAINGDKPSLWIADDGFVIGGGYHALAAKEIRLFFAEEPAAPALGWVKRAEDLPNAPALVLAGKTGTEFLRLWSASPSRFSSVKSVVFMSPPFTWKDVPSSLLEVCDVKLLVGSFAAALSEDYAESPKWVLKVPGAELYIPDWLPFVIGNAERHICGQGGGQCEERD